MTPQQLEQKTYELLDNLKIEYEVYQHEPMFTIEAAEEMDKKIGVPICKNLFLSTRHSTEFYLLFMQGHKKFHSGTVSKKLKVPRLTFGKDEYMTQFLKVQPGSVTPLSLFFDTENKVNLLVDSDVFKMEKISVHPCVNTATVVIKTSDFLEKILPACGHTYQEMNLEQ